MKRVFITFIFALLSAALFAQAPEAFKYQAVVRDGSGVVLPSTTVSFRFNIHETSATGTVVYSETHTPTTNGYGLVNLDVGLGTVVSGSFPAIDWSSDAHFFEVELDVAGGSAYVSMGTTQLLSVPYALHAKTAANVFSGDYNDLINAPTLVSVFTNDAGYLTAEVDGSVTNELQTLTLSSDTLYLSNGGFVELPAGFDGQYGSLTGAPTNVSAFTNDAGYLTSEVDGSVTNELQALSLSNDTLYLSNGGFVVLPIAFDGQYSSLSGAPTNVSAFTNDAGYITAEVDGSVTNELQALSISNDTLYLSNGGFAKLPAGFDGQYSSLTGVPTLVSVFTNDAGYITAEVDGSTTNEIQVLSISNDTLYLSNGGFAKLPSSFDGQYSSLIGAPTNVSAFANDAGYIAAEVDGDITNELQALTYSNDTLYLSQGGGAVGLAASSNTLEQAYNAGGAGAGRHIDVDAGKVELTADGYRGLQINADSNEVGLYVSGVHKADYASIFAWGESEANAIWGWQNGDSAAIRATATGSGPGVQVESVGAGDGMYVRKKIGVAGYSAWLEHRGTSSAMGINNIGDGDGLQLYTGPDGDDGLQIVFDGTGQALDMVVNTGDGIVVENASPTGIAVTALNLDSTNANHAIFGSTAGTNSAAMFQNDDNNANASPTMQVVQMGTGPGALFNTLDEATGKLNSAPVVDVVSNHKGPGINVQLMNMELGGDRNTEPGLLVTHHGFGNAAYFGTNNAGNTAATLEVLQEGSGNGLHVNTFDNPSANAEVALWIEQADASTDPAKGRVAQFEQQHPGTSTDAAVLIASAATSFTHTALWVTPSTTAHLAAIFDGKVEMGSCLTIADSIIVPYGVFSDLWVKDTLTASVLNNTSSLISPDATIGVLTVTGSITAPAKAFKIDHPLDPDGKYLLHNSIESDERVNIYSGNVTTDAEGFATVQMPDYMSALNEDFRYQLTVMGQSFAQAVVWEEIEAKSNQFRIRTNEPEITVSWQVTGRRHDTWAKENPMKVEVSK